MIDDEDIRNASLSEEYEETADGVAASGAPAQRGHAARRNPPKLDKDHGRKFRSRLPISAYCGANGSGKTLAMVHDTLPALFSGRDIWTTVPLTLPDGTTPSNVHVLTEWAQVLNATHADILLDEVSAIASSRDSQSMPPQVCTLLQQLRKRDLRLRWTAPSWNRADRVLRETTQLLTLCNGWISKTDPASQWRRHLLFRWRSYDAGDYTDFSDAVHTAKRLKPLRSCWYWLPSGLACHCYDSFAQVSTIGTVLDSGRCAICGGRRRVQECTCPDYLALRAAHKV